MSTSTLPALTRTEHAVAWLRDHAGDNAFLRSLLANFDRWGQLSEKQLLAVERNMNRPARVANPNPVTEQGMYRDAHGIVYRVKLSKQGRFYAMRFVPDAPVKSERFVYAQGVIGGLGADQRMTVEQAQLIGVQFGICCVCGAELTATESVANGIGPVCAKRV